MKTFGPQWSVLGVFLAATGCGAAAEGEDVSEEVDFGELEQALTPAQPGVRPNINSFNSGQRTTLVNAILAFITQPVIDEHANGHDWHHPGINSDLFFVRHHQYLNQLESYLLGNGFSQFVPVPEWDPGTAIPNEFMVADPLVGGPPTDQTPNIPVPPQFADSALCAFPSAAALAAALEGPFHDPVHVTVGGSMAIPDTASGVPIFWLWHGLLDDMYHERAWRCETLPAVLASTLYGS